jgi:prepilin-type processing-associated H-X9-DG protein
METEADVRGGDADFNDAYVYFKPLSNNLAEVYAQKASTGRELSFYDAYGRLLEANFGTTAHYKLPLLYGSFGMNVSAALPGLKPWHALYADYNEWSIVTEKPMNILASNGAQRDDDPAKMAKRNHMQKANVAFLDTHVELAGEGKLSKAKTDCALFHPKRPPNFWQGLKID